MFWNISNEIGQSAPQNGHSLGKGDLENQISGLLNCGKYSPRTAISQYGTVIKKITIGEDKAIAIR